MASPEQKGAIYTSDDLPVNIIDNRAKNNHQRPFFILPHSKSPEDGYRNISYRQISNAINRAAWWLDKNLSTVDKAEPYAYFGPLDLRYIILMLGSVKAMRKARPDLYAFLSLDAEN
jgi:acyl-coenzyme A synthetase/AMP-(fatty) acid ligase